MLLLGGWSCSSSLCWDIDHTRLSLPPGLLMSAWSPLIRTLVRNSYSEEEMNHLVCYVVLHTASGSTPLHYAALRRDARFVQFLLLQDIDVDIRNIYMETPLHWAVKQGHSEVVSLLLSSGAQAEAVDTEGLSPIDWAIQEEQDHILPLLRPSRPNPDRTSLEMRPSRSHSEPLPSHPYHLIPSIVSGRKTPSLSLF